MATRVAIFIDGSNFYGDVGRMTLAHKASGKLQEDEYYTADFEKLLKYLQQQCKDAQIVKVYYACSETDTTLKPKIEFYNKLNYLGIKVDIKRRKEGRKEKGVDMAIAMEMLILAHSNVYDEAILIAQDGDHCQLVQEVQRLGKRVGLADFGLFADGHDFYLGNMADFFIDLRRANLLTKHKKEIRTGA